jgi:SAM-dependent methyltransferase
MTREFSEIKDILCCPRCHCDLLYEPTITCSNESCLLFGEPFYVARTPTGSQPVLIDFETSIIDRATFIERAGESTKERDDLGNTIKSKLFRLLFGGNQALKRLQPKFLSDIKGCGSVRPRLLVVGGGAVGDGLAALYQDQSIDLIGFDVYVSPNITFVADGHAIPLANESVDAVVIQAVLEHVLDPSQVVSEIHRVLKPNGLVLADSPFMQQVHEGAYDFMRFTLSGHRWLFRNFSLIEAGVSGGPGRAALWNIRYFFRAILRNDKLGTIAQMSCFWLRYFDKLPLGRRGADAACGVFFYGSKGERAISPREIVEFYATQNKKL